MTKRELLNLYISLNKLGHLQGVKFAYGIAKNINILRPEVEAIQKAQDAAPEYIKFDQERIDLAQSMANKDEKGNPETNGMSYAITLREDFDREFKKLQDKYDEAIKDREKQMGEYEELLKEEVEVKLYKIKLSELPEAITTEEVNKIFNIIEE